MIFLRRVGSASLRRNVPRSGGRRLTLSLSALDSRGCVRDGSAFAPITAPLATAPNFSMSALKELRSTSGAPIVECRKALEAAAAELQEGEEDDDDTVVLLEKAVAWLRQHGAAKATSKVANRATNEGLVSFATTTTTAAASAGEAAVLVKVASETDFAGRSDTFVQLVEAVTQATLPSPVNVTTPVVHLSKDDIAATTVEGQEKTVQQLMDEAIVAIRENISVSDVRQLRATTGKWVGYVHNKVHPTSRAGTAAAAVLVEPAADSATMPTDELEAIGKKLAMHVVAARPQYLAAADITEAALEREREILHQQIAAEAGKPKPPEIVQKIVQGRLRKFAEQVCLLEQGHMVEDKNPKVGKFLKEKGVVLKQFEALFVS